MRFLLLNCKDCLAHLLTDLQNETILKTYLEKYGSK